MVSSVIDIAFDLNKDLFKKHEILKNPHKYLDLSDWEVLINEETGYVY